MKDNFIRKIFIPLLLVLTTVISTAQNKDKYESYFFPHKEGNKWGFVNKYGHYRIEPIFQEVYPFFEGLAVVKKKGKYGFINVTGNTIIDYKYDDAKSFKNSFAWVKKNGLEALIAKDGSLFMNYWFVRIEPFNNGYAKVVFKNDSISNTVNDEYIVAYIDKNGNQLSGKWFSGGGNFNKGVAKISIEEEYYFLDTSGYIKERVCDECDEATPFNPNLRADKIAFFPKGEHVLSTIIINRLKYPEYAIRNGIQGKVSV